MAYSDLDRSGMGAAFGGIGAGLGQMFMGGGDNPSDAANKYYNRIPGMLEKYMNPYIEAGQQAIPGLESQYGQLMNDPGGRLNQMGSSYQQSPGFKFALQQALQGAGHAAAAGGMAGSPQHEQQNMQIATNLANQDYNNWIKNAMGMYGQGLEGEQGLYNRGAQTGVGLGEDIGSVFANQGGLAAAGQAGQNSANSQMWGNLLGGAAQAIPFFL